jgi:hypothetical protein
MDTCQRDYRDIKDSLLSWTNDYLDNVKPVVDWDLHLRAAGTVATCAINDLSGWAANLTLNSKSEKQEPMKRFKSAPRVYHRDPTSIERKKSYEFKHFDETSEYIKQYRQERGVTRRSSPPPVTSTVNKSLSHLQIQFWRCDQGLSNAPATTSNPSNRQTHYTNVTLTSTTTPFSDQAICYSEKLTPHLPRKTDSACTVSGTARAQMVREALMAHRSNLYGKPLNSNSLVRVNAIGRNSGEEKAWIQKSGSRFKRRITRPQTHRYQEDIVEDMSESGADEKQARHSPTQSNASLESASSNHLSYISLSGPNQLSLQPSTQNGKHYCSYRLSRPKAPTPHVYRLGKWQEDSDTRDMAVVTPLGPIQPANESVAPHTQDAHCQTNQKSSTVRDCKGTPRLVEGLSNRRNSAKQHGALTSRGGGWRTSRNRNWCPPFRTLESRLSLSKQMISRPRGREEQLSLRNLLNVKRSQSGEITEKDEVGD